MNHLFIAVVFALAVGCAVSQDTRTETTCQTHKRNAGGSNALMNWDIKCDAEGKYLPMQCTVNTPKWCACYNKEKSVTQPSRSTKACECYLARDAAVKKSASPCDTPVCDRSGKFEKKQCCGTTQKCHCVDPITGQKTTEPTSNMNLQCR